MLQFEHRVQQALFRQMFISFTNKQEGCLLIKTVTQTGLLRQEKFGYAVQIKQNCGRYNISEEKCKKY